MRTYMRSGALKALLKSVECYEVNSPVPLQTGGRLVLFSTREQLQRSSSLVLFFFSFKLSLTLSLSLSLFSFTSHFRASSLAQALPYLSGRRDTVQSSQRRPRWCLGTRRARSRTHGMLRE